MKNVATALVAFTALIVLILPSPVAGAQTVRSATNPTIVNASYVPSASVHIVPVNLGIPNAERGIPPSSSVHIVPVMLIPPTSPRSIAPPVPVIVKLTSFTAPAPQQNMPQIVDPKK